MNVIFVRYKNMMRSSLGPYVSSSLVKELKAEGFSHRSSNMSNFCLHFVVMKRLLEVTHLPPEETWNMIFNRKNNEDFLFRVFFSIFTATSCSTTHFGIFNWLQSASLQLDVTKSYKLDLRSSVFWSHFFKYSKASGALGLKCDIFFPFVVFFFLLWFLVGCSCVLAVE